MPHPPLQRLHHVTATVETAAEDVAFYTRLLGLRLVKKTVNFDNPGVYHFYYGNTRGEPGTIMTTFPYGGKGVRVGSHGAGQVTATAFSVPEGALDFWRARLAAHGAAVREEGTRFGRACVAFDDPSGLLLELVATPDDRPPWTTDDLSAAHAVRGVYGVTLTLRETAPTRRLLQGVLGLEEVGQEGARTRFGVGGDGPGQVLDVLHVPEAPVGVNGIGTVHHVALSIADEPAQQQLQARLRQEGFSVTDVRDRQYFRSIYFREPGGVLLEVATAGPGFLVDEPEEALGRGLMLPPWEEPKRASIEAVLPQLPA